MSPLEQRQPLLLIKRKLGRGDRPSPPCCWHEPPPGPRACARRRSFASHRVRACARAARKKGQDYGVSRVWARRGDGAARRSRARLAVGCDHATRVISVGFRGGRWPVACVTAGCRAAAATGSVSRQRHGACADGGGGARPDDGMSMEDDHPRAGGGHTGYEIKEKRS